MTELEIREYILRRRAEGAFFKEIARELGRSTNYVERRVGVMDPLGPMAVDPGSLPRESLEQRVWRRFPIDRHKAG
jgi:hypothetical protein